MKAILTAIGTYPVYDPDEKGIPKCNTGAVGIEFKIGRRQYSRHIVFPLDIVGEKFESTVNQKSELLADKLMERAIKEVKDDVMKGYDLTDVETILRLKMPYLLHRAIELRQVVQTF